MDCLYQDELYTFYIEQNIPNQDHLARYLEMFKNTSVDEIISYIETQRERPLVEAKNIPQFSSFASVNGVLDIVYSSDGISFDEIGYYFFHDSGIVAQRKYGENHYKLAALLGLTTWKKPFEITSLGRAYMLMNENDKNNIISKLVIRIPIVQEIILKSKAGYIRPLELMETYLAFSTAKRRQSNVHYLVDMVVDNMEEDIQIEISKNLNWK